MDEHELLKDWTDVMKAAFENLQGIITPDYVRTVIVQGVRGLKEYSDIMALYRAFLSAQEPFRVTYF